MTAVSAEAVPVGRPSPRAWLRARICDGSGPLLLPGAPNALTARILVDVGFQAIYVSGAGVSNTYLGVPDVGLLSVTEMTSHVAVIRDVVDVPLVVDADTGFGNAVNVQRTVRALERAGADAVQIEDQEMPKRCGHFTGKTVIEPGEMVGKIHAATDARDDADLLIIARTDARAGMGLDAACDRAARYLEAGADMVFVEAPNSREEMRTIMSRVPGPHLANMVEGGRTPILPLAELDELGYAVVLYANTPMRAAISAIRSSAEQLLNDGDSLNLKTEIASWSERQRIVGKDDFDRLNDLYGSY